MLSLFRDRWQSSVSYVHSVMRGEENKWSCAAVAATHRLEQSSWPLIPQTHVRRHWIRGLEEYVICPRIIPGHTQARKKRQRGPAKQHLFSFGHRCVIGQCILHSVQLRRRAVQQPQDNQPEPSTSTLPVACTSMTFRPQNNASSGGPNGLAGFGRVSHDLVSISFPSYKKGHWPCGAANARHGTTPSCVSANSCTNA